MFGQQRIPTARVGEPGREWLDAAPDWSEPTRPGNVGRPQPARDIALAGHDEPPRSPRRDQETKEKFGHIDIVSQGKIFEPAGGTPTIDPPIDSAAAIRIDGVGICLIGGQLPDDAFSGWWCERQGAAATLPPLDPLRAGVGAARIGKTIYVVGGYSKTFDGTNRLEAYTTSAS